MSVVFKHSRENVSLSDLALKIRDWQKKRSGAGHCLKIMLSWFCGYFVLAICEFLEFDVPSWYSSDSSHWTH